MDTEAYSKRMAVAVRRELRQADGERFAFLLEYYRRRRGPGLALVETELEEHEKRHLLNHTPATKMP